MSKFFRGPGSKVHFLLNFIPFIIIFGIFLFSIVMKDNKLPEGNNYYTLTKPTTIHSVFKRDTVTHKLKKGEKIKILGYEHGSNTRPYSLWAETDKGYRGTIDITELGVPIIAWNEDNDRIDTVVNVISRSRDNFLCRFADGSEKKIDFNKIIPVLPDSLDKDSRHPEIGLVDKREVLGKVFFLFLPGTNGTDANGQPKVPKDFGRIGVVS